VSRDERSLVARAMSGDREAFDELVRPRWERMFRIALRVVGEREEAEDVAQRSCLRLWQTLGSYRPDEELDAWVYRMVTNLAIDSLRRRRVRRDQSAVVRSEDHLLRVSDPAPDPERRVLAEELERALQEVTDDLAPRQKAVFVLARVEGLTAPEIARLLDMAPSTARNHLFQARAHVARKLRERFPGLLGLAPAGDRGRD
jgi:RNA polymerase sigma-70 factor (ECF subfamily)